MRANVASVRKGQGLTLRDVADRLADIGHPMAHNTVSEIERGARRVDVDDLMALAAALGVTPTALLGVDSGDIVVTPGPAVLELQGGARLNVVIGPTAAGEVGHGDD